MADLDDMEMVECPVCGKRCPKDFYPLCNCGVPKKAKETAKKKPLISKKKKRS